MTETANLELAGAVAEALAARLERHFQIEPTFTLDQAAKLLGCSNEFLRKLCEACKAAVPGCARVHLAFDGLDDILTDIFSILEGNEK